MRNAIQRSDAYHWLNSGAATVASGSLVPLGGSLCGVAVADVAPGQLGALDTEGVYWLAAVEGEDIARGAVLNLDSATGELSAAVAGDAPGVALCWEAKANGEKRVQALLRVGGFASGGAAAVPTPLTARTVTGAATDSSDPVTAFNALAATLPPATTSSVVYWHQGATPYLYQGARGAPAVAASAADFLPLSVAGGPTRHAILSVTTETTNPVFDVTAAGAFYTHADDTNVSLGASAAEFRDDEAIDLLINGRSRKLDSRVTWIDATHFQWTGVVNNGDEFEVRSP